MPEPSLRYVVVSLHGETRTMCFRGRNWRVESRGRAHIENRDLRRSFDLDLESRVYTARPLNVRVRGGKRLPPSGRPLYVYTETADTGERREMFGYTARRVLIRTTLRLSTETGPCQSTESDGWYIGPPAAWPPSHGHAILLAGAPGGIDAKSRSTRLSFFRRPAFAGSPGPSPFACAWSGKSSRPLS